jgi:predicted phage terminase large subunit-like protein
MNDEYEYMRKDLITFYYGVQSEILGEKFTFGDFDEQLLSALQFDFMREQLNNTFPCFTIEAPVQHGKSVKIQTFMCWWLGVMGGYGQHFVNYYTSSDDLAKEFDTRISKVFDTQCFKEAFGEVLHPRKFFFKFGESTLNIRLSNAGNTGYPSHLTIIDDPYSNHKEAVSPVLRENAWLSCTANLLGRVNNGAGAIFLHSRWHTDDIIGRIKKNPFKGWTVRSYKWKAIKDNGEALFPEIMPLKLIEAKRGGMPDWAFQAQLMQEPFNIEGNKIPVGKINIIDELPDNIDFNEVLVVADTAFSTKKSADDTAISVVGMANNGIYLLDLIYGKFNFTQLVLKLKEGVDSGRGFGRFSSAYIENKASGQSLIQVLRSDPTVDFNIEELYPTTKSFIDGSQATTDKLTRYYEIATIIEKGKFFVLNSDWTADFIEQCSSFNGDGKGHDDLVEAGLIYPLKLAKDYQMIDWGATGREFSAENKKEELTFSSIYDDIYEGSIAEALYLNGGF